MNLLRVRTFLLLLLLSSVSSLAAEEVRERDMGVWKKEGKECGECIYVKSCVGPNDRNEGPNNYRVGHMVV